MLSRTHFVASVKAATLISLCVVLTGCVPTSPLEPAAPPGTYPDGSLALMLEQVRKKQNLPAMAAAIVEGDSIAERAVVGMRKSGDPTPAQIDDKWHIGSITKSVTATVAARLVDGGIVRWETTVAEALPDLASAGNTAWRSITLAELLTMRAGIDDAAVDASWPAIWARRGDDPVVQRREAARILLATKPAATAGGQWRYANASVALAGHMLERIAKRSWESLVRDEVFTPLRIADGGFGAPASTLLARPDQPWGHTSRGRAMTPVKPGLDADNPAAIGPAGTVHMSIADLASYARMHLASLRGSTALLSNASAQRIHTSAGALDTPGYPAGAGYAMGWLVLPGNPQDGVVLMHDGSNRSFYAVVVLQPVLNRAFVIAANAGDATAGTALSMVLDSLSSRHTSRTGISLNISAEQLTFQRWGTGR